jgi:uncharacterized protein (TIGR00369 family)
MADLIKHLRERFEQGSHPFFGKLDIEIIQASDGHVSLLIQPDTWAALNKDEPIVHSGLITLLLDTVCGMAVMSSMENPLAIATIDLKIDHIRDINIAEQMLIEAKVVESSGTVSYTDGQVRGQKSNQLIAKANGSFMIGTKGPSIIMPKTEETS